MAALYARLRRTVLKAGVNPAEITAILIEPQARLMKEMPEGLADYARKRMEADGVRVLTGVRVERVTPTAINLSNGEEIHPTLLLWDTGIEPSPLLPSIDVPKGKHHGVVTDSCFRVVGLENVWALGDCAETPRPGSESTYAPTAQNAVREGYQLAMNISAVIRGRQPHPFRYTMLGQLALVSEHDAVATMFGIPLRGVIAWAAWWLVYLAKLPGMTNRLRVLRNFTAGD